MSDFVSQITNLKAEFQRLADRAPSVRAAFQLKVSEGKFCNFVLGPPVEDARDAPILRGVRSSGEAATITELYALTDEAGKLALGLCHSGHFRGNMFSTKSINYLLHAPRDFWLALLLHTPPISFHCWAMGSAGRKWIAAAQVCESDIVGCWIDSYAQVCVSALTYLREGSGAVLPADGVPRPNRWTRRGPLGLTLDTNAHSVERNGQLVDFGANGRLWEVFVKLADRHPAKYLVRDLGHDVWNHDGRDQDPSDNQVQQAICAVRVLLKPLGVAVEHSRKVGYVLTNEPDKHRPK